MLRYLADEDCNNDIVRGLLREATVPDIVRVQDVGLLARRDAEVLEWAAREGRIILTHDVRTMIGHAYNRVRAGLPLPGLFVVPQSMPIGRAVEDLHLLATCSLAGERQNRVLYLPLRSRPQT
jgi:hypothetical protein